MGFIDYHGTKEDRYEEIVEHAKAQQEEEFRRRKDAKVSKWMQEILGTQDYTDLPITDIIKYVIVKYRKLSNQYCEIIAGKENKYEIDTTCLWNDFSIWIIEKHIEPFDLSYEKKITYYQTISDKVFKLSEATNVAEHYKNKSQNIKYQKYFADCFELAQEKQFWKLFGEIGSIEKLDKFIDTYSQLSVLFEYYMFMGLRPDSDEWMRRGDVQRQILDAIKAEYKKGHLKNPLVDKLQNPLYKPTKSVVSPEAETLDNAGGSKEEAEESIETEPIKPRRPQLDRSLFEKYVTEASFRSYVEACKLLLKCELPESIDSIYRELIRRIPVLEETIKKFEDAYTADVDIFFEYYIPEALNLTANYLEYLDAEVSEKILVGTEREVVDASNKLLLAVNGKIDEIYKFASIEIKARSKALESLMSQDGYVDQEFKINKTGGSQS